MFRALLIVLLFFTIGWSTYWWAGSTAQQTGLVAWLEDRRSQNWVADYSELKVKGYPSRFDTSITDINLADPRSGWAWVAPHFQIHMLSYKPNHAIAVWPQNQVIATPEERITVHSKDIRASIKFDANTDLALSAATVEMSQVKLKSNAGWSSEIKKAKIATRQSSSAEFSHDLFFQADDVKPARMLKRVIDPKNLLPDVFKTMKIDVTAGFDAAWDRNAVEGRKPELTDLKIEEFNAIWGELEFQATGQLEIDEQGFPNGKISVRAKNWKEMLELGVGAGFVPDELVSTLSTGLGLLAQLSGNPDTIDAPLSFKNRVMSVGPFPIGRAPQIRLNP